MEYTNHYGNRQYCSEGEYSLARVLLDITLVSIEIVNVSHPHWLGQLGAVAKHSVSRYAS